MPVEELWKSPVSASPVLALEKPPSPLSPLPLSEILQFNHESPALHVISRAHRAPGAPWGSLGLYCLVSSSASPSLMVLAFGLQANWGTHHLLPDVLESFVYPGRVSPP